MPLNEHSTGSKLNSAILELGKTLQESMQDDEFKLDLFRFVDVLPTLSSWSQVSEHVREYLVKEDRALPGILSAALKVAWGGIAAGLASRTLKKNVAEMATRFIVASSPDGALLNLRKLHDERFSFTADLLGESTLSDTEAITFRTRYLELIDTLSQNVLEWKEEPQIDRSHTGPIPRTNVSVKVSALSPHLDPVNRSDCVRKLKEFLMPIFRLAREKGVFVNLDLEQWNLHDITYDLFEEIATCREFKSWPHLGIVVQAYLKSAESDVERLLSISRSRQSPITIRLVKGAYWNYEVVNARRNGYPCPVFTEKAETDQNYERLTEQLFHNIDRLHPAFGSHNLRSLAHAIVLAREMGLSEQAFEIQMLYGMAEPERKALRDLGHRVRLYCPIGEMLSGMAYLVRRLLENTSNSGFLRLSHHENTDIATLMQQPMPQGKSGTPSETRPDATLTFVNCSLTNFTDRSAVRSFANAVSAQLDSLPLVIPGLTSSKKQKDTEQSVHRCPSDLGIIVTRVNPATIVETDAAIKAALQAYPAWRDRPISDRTQILRRLGDQLENDRYELAALQAVETAKPWREADGDVAEAVDFCRYYSKQALEELSPRCQGDMWGEENSLVFEGRGPTAIIAPWNFPLAILCGMASAALVSGNPVLMKPSRQSSGTAFALYSRMLEAGFPEDTVHLLPGPGEQIGAHLVDHPAIAQIAFTGSKAVGLTILERAARVYAGQPQIKRVVCEMGGKNAIIVDDDADLDEAVLDVSKSAFGYAGQKCSACSRVLVVGAAWEPFRSRIIQAADSLEITPAHQSNCELGPVIDESAYHRLQNVIRSPGEGAHPIYIGKAPKNGYFVPPAIFECDSPNHRLMQEELFGPILAVMQVESFEEAIKIANETEFALTGGVFSRHPGHLRAAREQFRVGNLYLNRGTTGAFVHRQPFGGFGMSGIGTKAGGPGYLSHFVDPRVVTENTIRRGFTPDVAM